MIKRVNFTGRRRIPQTCIEIEVFDGTPRTFSAAIDLSATKMPFNSKVFLEAMCSGSTIVKRFDFGLVEQIMSPNDCSLDSIEGQNVFFALKVVDESDQYGRILGIAENIRPIRAGNQTETGRRGILPIEEQPLGQDLWKLSFGEHDVTLIVNSDVTGLKERARWDPLFYSVVYPTVVRMILSAAIDRGVSLDDDSDDWPTIWLRFGHEIHPEHLLPPLKEEGEDELEEWIGEVVAAFAEMHTLKDQYVAKAILEDQDGTEI